MSSGLGAEFADVLEGRPGELGTRASELQRTAAAIERAAESLADLVADQHSQATDAVAGSADDAASGLRRAHGRYDGTASALTTYAVELDDIHRQARAQIEAADEAAAQASRLQGEIDDLGNEIVQTEAEGESSDRLAGDRIDAYNDLAAANGSVDDARGALQRLRERLWQAADDASRAIETAIEDGADSFGDNWNQFWDGVGDFFAMVGEWAAAVLAPLVAVLRELLSALLSVLVVLAILVVAAVALGIVFLAFGLVGVLVVLAAAGIALLAMLIAELLARPQQSSGAWTSGAPTGDAPADGAQDALEAGDYHDLLTQLKQQDSEGAAAGRTEIRVVAVRDAAGNITGWRVQLPSTQDWNPLNTNGQLNDVRTDVLLSMFPGVPTQYEQAVWDAMTEAGVFESEAPIMFTGWSLGGMMAGDLTADPRVADRVESVFTAGSAIDKHYDDIPPDVRVTQINNGWDPVHTLELIGLDPIDYLRFDNDWQTYRPISANPFEGHLFHDADMYGDMAEYYLPEPRPGDGVFFADPGEGSYEDVYTASYTRGS